MGMTAGAVGGQNTEDRRVSVPGSRLSAVACLMMLERVNYLLSSGIQLPRAESGIQLPRAELIDRLTAIMVAAFGPPVRGTGAQPPSGRSGRCRANGSGTPAGCPPGSGTSGKAMSVA